MILPALFVQLTSGQTDSTRVIQESMVRLPFFARYAYEVFVLPLRPEAPLTGLEVGTSQRRTSQIRTTRAEVLRAVSTLLYRAIEAAKTAPQKEMQLKPMKAQLLKMKPLISLDIFETSIKYGN
jgi:hypothetical protein